MAGAGKVPRVQTKSEPIAEVTKVVQPIGQKNVAGTQINPATEDTLSAKLDAILDDLKGAYRLGVKDFAVASGEVIFISSGSEVALNNLSIAGVYRNDGLTTVKEALSVTGRLINNGTLEIGGRW